MSKYYQKDQNQHKRVFIKRISFICCATVVMSVAILLILLYYNSSLKYQQRSFYQKLSDGLDVDILIVGDSIGAVTGEKSWTYILEHTIEEAYDIDARITNVSMGGNTSYAGYVRVNTLDDGIDYDLAILCYGQNDNLDNFNLYYESIIRAIYLKYESCSIISILESSQRQYTEKMLAIEELAEYYNIPVADTIAAFNNSVYKYDELSNDGVHPNDAGNQIYAETVLEIINQCVKADRVHDSRPEAYVEGVEVFDSFLYIDVKKFEIIDDTTIQIDTTILGSPIMGIDYSYQSGEQVTEIYIDGKLYSAPTVTFNYDFSQRHINIIGKSCEVCQNIKIVFENAEALEGFYGLVFSNIK